MSETNPVGSFGVRLVSMDLAFEREKTRGPVASFLGIAGAEALAIRLNFMLDSDVSLRHMDEADRLKPTEEMLNKRWAVTTIDMDNAPCRDYLHILGFDFETCRRKGQDKELTENPHWFLGDFSDMRERNPRCIATIGSRAYVNKNGVEVKIPAAIQMLGGLDFVPTRRHLMSC